MGKLIINKDSMYFYTDKYYEIFENNFSVENHLNHHQIHHLNYKIGLFETIL